MKQYSAKYTGTSTGVASRKSNAVPNSGNTNSRVLKTSATASSPAGAASSNSTYDTKVSELKGPVGEAKGVTGKSRYMTATPGESGAQSITPGNPLRSTVGAKDINTVPVVNQTVSVKPKRSGRNL